MAEIALSRSKIEEYLGKKLPDGQLYVLQSIDSTNTEARRLAAQGAVSGTVVTAEGQTGGRGRRGRQFFSPAGEGLYFSMLFRPTARPEQMLHLTAMAAVAGADAIGSVCGLQPDIKWTNDLVVGRRKLAGILTELSVKPGTCETDYVVIGIGINCAQVQFPPEIRSMATSIRMESGKSPDRNALAAALIREFTKLNAELLTGRADWMQRFTERCITVGKSVQVIRADTVRRAEAEGIDPSGALLVRYEDGTTEAVQSGEVSIRGMYGYADDGKE